MVAYCRCGLPVLVEYVWTGFELITTFRSLGSGPKHLAQIRECPDCGDPIRERSLIPEAQYLSMAVVA